MYEFIYEEAGKRIRLLREERNLSRDILSERAEISAKFLYEIESGKKGFSADTLYRLSKALNVPSEYILSGNCSINDISEYIPKAKLFILERYCINSPINNYSVYLFLQAYSSPQLFALDFLALCNIAERNDPTYETSQNDFV